SGMLTVWARDWSPLGALTPSGDLHLLDLNYYPSRPADDSTGRTMAGFKGVPRVSLPVYNEGGNFMANEDGDCLMTTRVTDANAEVFKTGDLILDAVAVKSYYRDFAGCRQTTILPRMPNERTGHIDMWGKFLDNDTIIVGEISAETLSYARTSSDSNFATQIQSFLNKRASDLQQLGFDVVRIPMPLPRPGLFRSYTNSLLVNGTALIPQYQSRSQADSALLADYETKVTEIYQAAGYRVVFIPSDELIAAGGAVHCVTMQIPRSFSSAPDRP
ncbi:MAG: agmatine deiminase family protein, partial [Oligoflexus sp.]